jgi:hypothetical protein
MRRRFCFFALLISAALIWRSFAATSLASISTSAKSTLIIDGVACDRVLSWEGGDRRGTLLTQPSSTGGVATKSIANTAIAPLVLQVSLPLSPQLAAVVNDLCSARFVRHTLVVVDDNSTGVATAAFELSNALLSRVTFPALDATSSAIDPVKLVFDAERSNSIAVPSARAISSVARSVSTFQLSIDGVDASRTVRIEPITISVHASAETIGDTRSYTAAPASVDFSTLGVTVSAASEASWKAWWTDFVVNGNATDGNEKNAVLRLIDSSGAPMNLALNFTHVGILRLSRPVGTAGVASKLDAEMYFEGLSLNAPTATSSTSSASTAAQTAATDPAAATNPPATDTTATNATGSSSTSTDSGTAASSTTGAPSSTVANSTSIASRTPTTTDVPLVSSTTNLSAAQKALLNPADVGSRDPAQFPRVDGLTRTSYEGTFQSTYTSEGANYTSTEAIEQLVARVDAAAKAAGWTMTTVTETAPNGGKNVGETWTKPSANATVSYSQPINATGTQFSLQVYVQLAASN